MPSESRLTHTALSVLDLAPVQQGGTAGEAFARSIALAQHVEKLGYRRFWLAEHHNIVGVACSATSLLIGHVAAATSTIRVGSGGIMLPNHAPLAIAEQFGTLASLYPGRIDLGLGRAPGGDYAVIRAFHRDLRRAGDDFPDQLAQLRDLLAPAHPGQTLRAIPGEGTDIPVYLLGSSDFSARLAAQLGLPFAFAGHFMPDGMLTALQIYRANFRPSAVLDRPYSMAGIPVIAAPTDAEAAHLATTAQQRFLALIRSQPIPLVPPVDSMDGLWNDFERAAVESRLRAAVIGSPDTVQRGLEHFLAQTQVDELIVVTDTYDLSDRLRSYEIVADAAKLAGREAVHAAD